MKLLIPLLLLFFPYSVYASGWSYPLDRYPDRASKKEFAQYFDTGWYRGKEAEFPLKFTGYHTGIDLEIFPQEQNLPVPVYAVTSGKIAFAGNVSGYGGVILFRPESDPVTFLYGHVKLSGVKTGEDYSPGQVLSYLGDAFSSQTGGERKHLHFAIYRGTNNYFRGYEESLSGLQEKFYNPNSFLTVDLPSPTPQLIAPRENISPSPPPITIWTRLMIIIRFIFWMMFGKNA